MFWCCHGITLKWQNENSKWIRSHVNSVRLMCSVWFTSHCIYSISLNFYFFLVKVLSWSLRRIVVYISCIALVGSIFFSYLVGNAWLPLIVFVDFLLKPFLHLPKRPLYISPLHYVAQFWGCFFVSFFFDNCFSLEEAPRSRSLPSLSVMKTLTAINPGQLAVFISSLSINGYECEGYGFKIMNCKSFVLKPNTSRKIEIT